tara:strand:+ start:3833 stop:4009 length:177 start_codon:yes stop_codon:yes gene_type:complete
MCLHDWKMTDAEMTGWEMCGDTPEFYGSFRAICQLCGAIHEADFIAMGDDLPFGEESD